MKPYNKNIFDPIWCSAARLWWRVQSWPLELVADVSARWKRQVVEGQFKCLNKRSKNTKTFVFKRWETRWMLSGVLSCSDAKTQSEVSVYKQLFACFPSRLKELYPGHKLVWLHVLVLVNERTSLNFWWDSHFLKRAYFDGWSRHLHCPSTTCCFQRALTSATSSSRQDCTLHHINATEHRMWSKISLMCKKTNFFKYKKTLVVCLYVLLVIFNRY